VTCDVRPRKVVLRCKVQKAAPEEEKMVQEKGDLFELVYKHRLEVQWVMDEALQKAKKGKKAAKEAAGQKGKSDEKKKEKPKAKSKTKKQDDAS